MCGDAIRYHLEKPLHVRLNLTDCCADTLEGSRLMGSLPMWTTAY